MPNQQLRWSQQLRQGTEPRWPLPVPDPDPDHERPIASLAMKPSIVIDKSWLQEICELSRDQADRTFASLADAYQPVVPLVLIEEVLAHRFRPEKDQTTVPIMIQAILNFHPRWMEHPLELVFRELVKKEPIADTGLSQDQATKAYVTLKNPEAASPSLAKWMADREREKKQRRDDRIKQQTAMRKVYELHHPELLRPQNLAAFAQNGDLLLKDCLKQPKCKQRMLEAYLGQIWNRRHPEHKLEFDDAFARLDYQSLGKLPFTYSYILAELLYDQAPITYVGPPGTEEFKQPIISSKPSSQFNNEEDQEYVVSALHCDGLLTRDKGMSRIANAFKHAGFWKGSVYMQ